MAVLTKHYVLLTDTKTTPKGDFIRHYLKKTCSRSQSLLQSTKKNLSTRHKAFSNLVARFITAAYVMQSFHYFSFLSPYRQEIGSDAVICRS